MKREHIFVLIILSTILLTPSIKADAQPTIVGEEGKDKPNGHIVTEISGKCGKDYRLVSPSKATSWSIRVTVTSEIDQSIHIHVILAEGEYPYGDPIKTASGRKTCTLSINLNPSKTYEIWIRDAYAKRFTGTIEEWWSGKEENTTTAIVSTITMTELKTHTTTRIKVETYTTTRTELRTYITSTTQTEHYFIQIPLAERMLPNTAPLIAIGVVATLTAILLALGKLKPSLGRNYLMFSICLLGMVAGGSVVATLNTINPTVIYMTEHHKYTETSATTTTITSLTFSHLLKTTTQTATKTETVSNTYTTTATETVKETTSTTITVQRSITGGVLLKYSGSGDANSPPFTATTDRLEITIKITATAQPSYVVLYWYLYRVGAGEYDWSADGSVEEAEGTFTFYAYNITPGREYYIKISSANCRWTVIVKEA